MYKSKAFNSFLLHGLILIFGVSATLAQVDPTTKPRKTKVEIAKIYSNWLKKDVRYIITEEEKKAFKALKTDEERENFIENFWRRRDPNPDTEENEYREEYYERIAYANERYTSGKPGWMTDRGRIYITWGKPDGVESYPMGGSYNRPAHEGGGSTTTYPFEIWFYRHLEGIGSGIEVEFVDPTGSGEYRIARNPNEKDALLHVPGAGLTTSESLGLSSKADRITGINTNQRYTREQDAPFRRLQILTDLQRPPKVKYADLEVALTNSPVIDTANPLDFDLRVDFFRQSDKNALTTFTLQTDSKELTFRDEGGIQTARMNIFGRITAITNKRAGIFEDAVLTHATSEGLAAAKKRKLIYQTAVILKPGATYKVNVAVRDVATGKIGTKHLGFTVPKFDAGKLWTSTLILASELRATTDADIGGRFVIGNTKVIPNLSGVYKRGQKVGLYLQVYNAKIDQTTLRPGVDVKYTLVKDGKVVLEQKEDWSGLSDSGQRLTLARLLPTDGFPLGDYQVKIKIVDSVGKESRILKPTAKFTIKE